MYRDRFEAFTFGDGTAAAILRALDMGDVFFQPIVSITTTPTYTEVAWRFQGDIAVTVRVTPDLLHALRAQAEDH